MCQGHPRVSTRKRDRLIVYIAQISDPARAMDFCISRLIYIYASFLRQACAVMPLHMHTCLCAGIVLNFGNFMAPLINNYHICANACLKHSNTLTSA